MNRATDWNSLARAACALLTLTFAGAELAAQNRPIAFPQGGKSGTRGNWGPLGEACTGDFVESRTQILFPAEYLPTRAGTVWKLDHIPTGLSNSTISCPGAPVTVQYALLEITLAHRSRGAGPLSTTFDGNLPSTPPPPVFSQAWTRTWVIGNWNGIPFAQGFAYDGVSDIVVQIRKVVTPTGANVGSLRNLNPPRPGHARQVAAVGGAGSGAANAATGSYTNVLGWRLHFDNVPDPTLEVRSPLGTNNLHFENGTTPHFRVFDSQGDLFAIAANFDFLPFPTPVAPLAGGLWLNPVFVLSSGFVIHLPGEVYHRFAFPLPMNPGLAGLRICAQAVTLDPGSGLGDLTNAVDFVIQ